MASETIYEGLGEVMPMENGNTSMSSDEGSQSQQNGPNAQLLFNQETTDEAVVEAIFNRCDVEKTGFVRASTLVEFLFSTCGDNNMRDKFQDLLYLLDPTVDDPLVNVETFQSALKSWVCEMMTQLQTEGNDCQLDLSSLKFQFEDEHSDSKDSSSSDSPACNLDVKELQHQYNRLQEENKLLHEQMVDVEETNSQLKAENSMLKAKMHKVELEVKELGNQSKMLQDDNGELLGHLQHMKDDLQKMTVHYNDCQKQLENKVLELETIRLNNSMEKERSDHLIDAIRELEELIAAKEDEIATKDKDIQRITQNLLEQQLSVDSLANEFDRSKGQGVGDNNLAAELQSSFAINASWQKGNDSRNGTKSDFANTAWSMMLNEPEFEEEKPMRLSSPHRRSKDACDFDEDIIRQADKIVASPIDRRSMVFLEHSTPVSGFRDKTECVKWNNSNKEDLDDVALKDSSTTDLTLSVKQLMWVSLYITCIFVLLFVGSAVTLLLISANSGPECGSAPHYFRPIDYYQSSLWSKVMDYIKPFCRIEYHSYPPV